MLGTGPGFGGGELDERVVRGIVFAGWLTSSRETRRRAFWWPIASPSPLDGTLPKVPLDGQAGAGEILPMMHVMSETFTGDFEEGEWMTLVNGSPCRCRLQTPRSARTAPPGERRGRVRVVRGSAPARSRPTTPALDLLWGDEHEAAALRELRTLTSWTEDGQPSRAAGAGEHRILRACADRRGAPWRISNRPRDLALPRPLTTRLLATRR